MYRVGSLTKLLNAREVLKKPDETIWKEENPNTLKTDKLLSSLLLCKSKTSKRSIPAHEELSKPLAIHLMIANARIFVRRKNLANKELPLIVNGDSTYSAMLMNSSLQTKNILLRGAVLKTIYKCKQVLEMLPKAVIQFTWSEGKTNPADLLTKLLLDLISQINSELFRLGPNLYQSNKEVLKSLRA